MTDHPTRPLVRRSRAAAACLLLASVAAPFSAAGSASAQVARVAAPVSGSRSALVITVALQTQANVPESVPTATPAEVAQQVATNSRPWFEQVSHGIFGGYFALARGPVHVRTTSAPCSAGWWTELGDSADKAVTKNEFLDLTQFAAVIYYFDEVHCPAGQADARGWANVGPTGRRVWLNGATDLGTVTHELGHNLGLTHAGSERCADQGHPVVLSASCTQNVYGGFSAMAGAPGGDFAGYNAPELDQLGWNVGHVKTVTLNDPTATYVVRPPNVTTPNAIQALRLIDGSTTLWLGFNAFGGSSIGLLWVLREHNGANGTPLDGSPFLLDMDPSDGVLDPMLLGQTWTDPLGAMTITLNSNAASGASVTVRTSPPLKVVPDIRGLVATDAANALTSAGLTPGAVGTTADWTCSHLGVVITQSAAPGTSRPVGSPVAFNIGVEPSGPPGTPLPC